MSMSQFFVAGLLCASFTSLVFERVKTALALIIAAALVAYRIV